MPDPHISPSPSGSRPRFRTVGDVETAVFRLGRDARPHAGTAPRQTPAGVVIVGAAGSGKDTLVDFIRADFDVTPIGFADPLRSFVAEMLGAGKHRTVAQALGDVVWAADPDAFVRRAQHRALQVGRYIITDARLPEELSAFPEALTIGLDAPASLRAARLAARDGAAYQSLGHVTETRVPALLAQSQVRLMNDGPDLSSFRALYQTALYPRLREHFHGARLASAPSP